MRVDFGPFVSGWIGFYNKGHISKYYTVWTYHNLSRDQNGYHIVLAKSCQKWLKSQNSFFFMNGPVASFLILQEPRNSILKISWIPKFIYLCQLETTTLPRTHYSLVIWRVVTSSSIEKCTILSICILLVAHTEELFCLQLRPKSIHLNSEMKFTLYHSNLLLTLVICISSMPLHWDKQN